MKEVEKWLKKGKKNCDKGNHWFMLDYGTHMICPVCGINKPMQQPREDLPEYNAYIVCTPEIKKAG